MTLVRPLVTRAAVPFHFLENGEPVGASDWNRIAHDLNYAAASGRVIVPSFRPATELDLSDGDTTWTMSLWLEPSYQAIERIVSVTYRFHASSGASIRASGAGDIDVLSPKLVQRSVVGSQTTTGAAVDVTFSTLGTQESGYVTIDGVQVVELPRAFLENDTNERGIDASVFVSGQPIMIARGVDAIRDATADDTQIGRRVLLAYAEPYATSRQGGNATESGAGGDVITSASFVTVRGGSGSPALARKTRTTDTTRTVKARAFARCSNGTTTGEVRFVSSVNGASSAITFDGSVTTNFAWSSEVDLTVDCEDLGDVRGLQSSTFDEVSVEARRTAGAGNLQVAGWVLYEDGP
ncbi:MAG: hypothetical protein H6721_12335 [Sandaracinus sp.]|nr:hypothetical protein [Sandaracinus sp.]